ncbi:unnamed protein product, partial [Adineta steineri]
GDFSGGGSGSSCTGDNCFYQTVMLVSISGVIGLLILIVGVSNYWKGRPTQTNIEFIKNDTIKNCNQEKSDTSMFKSGCWKSQYFQYVKWCGSNRLCLLFDNDSMTVIGAGSDYVGYFTINGIYSLETSRLGLSKKYQLGTGNETENLGHTVTIQLTWNKIRNQFEGKWYVQTKKYHDEDVFQLKFDG